MDALAGEQTSVLTVLSVTYASDVGHQAEGILFADSGACVGPITAGVGSLCVHTAFGWRMR